MFTAAGELLEKRERLQALLRSDLAAVIEAAVTVGGRDGPQRKVRRQGRP